ncbi:MAG: hypothetical protein E7773_00145 [Sphingomonas sp.]|uniref:hypothetical protein n=1 Tax=Sphingomonas sp. TaxID=28214 RepID=UPI001219708D|nr:hypothetical protein [Sphingomonas sp.]THD38208.1 MAG: hypothetical protein E7773_00145 [Sphingomonas sp.]
MNGRPLRFLGATIVGWVALRAFVLWPVAGPAAIPRALVPAAFADDAPRIEGRRSAPAVAPINTQISAASTAGRLQRPGRPDVARVEPTMIADPPSPPASEAAAPLSTQTAPQTLLAPPPPTAPPARSRTSRWSASAWFVLRDGQGIAPGLSSGQLGGSQAGLRVAYAIGEARRVAIVGRVASPLRGRGREAALGVEWRPTKLPVRLVAEYRRSLDGGASGPALGIIAGTGPAPLALGFDLETYGQAGAIRRRRTEPFAEGAARLSRPVVALGGAKVDLALGAWGGAQRDAQRLDIGPSLGVRVPVAGKSLRLSLDWRQRVAGSARPGSGPVLVIGSDF